MDATVRKVRAHIARLNVLAAELDELYKGSSLIPNSYLADFQDIIAQIGAMIGEKCSFLSDYVATNLGHDVYTASLRLRVKQAISFFNEAYAKELGFEQVNITLDGLRDRILKDRCADLLRANGHFDRAVNQATLVLEDRLRQKSPLAQGLTGVQLVNALIKAEREKSPLILSSDDGEQRGFADIARGIMAAHRNPTHHSIYAISQLDAARICAYIDVLLEIIDDAKPNAPLQGHS